MEPFTGCYYLAVFHAYTRGHVLLDELDAAQVCGESVPEIPGSEIYYKMKPPILYPCINAPQARGVFKEDGAGISDGHIGLVCTMPVLLIHTYYLLYLCLQVLAVCGVFSFFFCGCHKIGEIFLKITFSNRIGDAKGGGYVGQKGSK